MSGIDTSVTNPGLGTSATYIIICVGSGGTTADSVTVGIKPPAVSLSGRVSPGPWQSDDITIRNTDQIILGWYAFNVTSSNAACTATSTPSGGNFNAFNYYGTDYSITEPALNDSTTYTITCTDGIGGSVTDSITVTKLPPTATLEISTDGGSSYSGDNTVIYNTSGVNLRWSSTYANSCSGWGSGFYTGNRAEGEDAINPPSDRVFKYTLTCRSGTASSSDSLLVFYDDTRCEITCIGVVEPSGEEDVNVNSTEVTCEMECSNKFGVSTKVLSIRVAGAVVDLEKSINGSDWDGSSGYINDNSDTVDLRWNSELTSSNTNVTIGSCSGRNFSTGTDSPINGTTTDISNKPSTTTTSVTYTVTCYGTDDAGDFEINDFLTLRIPSLAPAPGNLDISANRSIIRKGDEVDISWDIGNNPPANCSVRGKGFSGPVSSATGTKTGIVLEFTETFTLSCTGQPEPEKKARVIVDQRYREI